MRCVWDRQKSVCFFFRSIRMRWKLLKINTSRNTSTTKMTIIFHFQSVTQLEINVQSPFDSLCMKLKHFRSTKKIETVANSLRNANIVVIMISEPLKASFYLPQWGFFEEYGREYIIYMWNFATFQIVSDGNLRFLNQQIRRKIVFSVLFMARGRG